MLKWTSSANHCVSSKAVVNRIASVLGCGGTRFCINDRTWIRSRCLRHLLPEIMTQLSGAKLVAVAAQFLLLNLSSLNPDFLLFDVGNSTAQRGTGRHSAGRLLMYRSVCANCSRWTSCER